MISNLVCRFPSVNHITILVTTVYLLIKYSSPLFFFLLPIYKDVLPRFSFFSIYCSISKQYSTFYFHFLPSYQFFKPIAALLQFYHCTEISCLKIKKPVMDRINDVFSSTSYLIPLRHLEIMITISLKFSSPWFCSILWLLLSHLYWLSLLHGLPKRVSTVWFTVLFLH